ncbi:MAG TPA: hypothetical protein VIJ59_02210 [Caulobacteraceae bacterium]
MPPHFLHLFHGSPAWLLVLASLGLIGHVGGGTVGILAGAGALIFRKGERLHRAFGKVFVVAMLINGVMATSLATVLVTRGVSQQMSNVFGGIFTFYLVSTAWMTARRPPGTVGRFEIGALVFALGIAALALIGLVKLANGGATDNGVPIAAPIIFAGVALLAAGADLKVILRGGVSGAARIARHLWRMCAGWFIASASFFIGQQQVMPKFIQGSPVLIVLGVAPLLAMIFWLGFVAFTGRFRQPVRALAA